MIMETAYSNSFGFTQLDGSIVIYCSTNDNLDYGEPSEFAEWTSKAKDRAQFDKIYGKSRTGCVGTVVTVTLDGKTL